MKTTSSLPALFVMLTTSAAIADSNGTLGAVINSETQVLGGPFDHRATTGDASNSTASATFTGGFNATEISISGDITGVIPFKIGVEDSS